MKISFRILRSAAALASAPGRIEVLGNHTDYNEGTVLSAAINTGHCFCISACGSPGVSLTAADMKNPRYIRSFVG